MQYFIKNGLGGDRKVGVLTTNTGHFFTLATFSNGPEQRLMLDALRVGLTAAGHTLEKLP